MSSIELALKLIHNYIRPITFYPSLQNFYCVPLFSHGNADTVLMDVDVQARKVEIEQTHQLLQDFQKAHDEAIAKFSSS